MNFECADCGRDDWTSLAAMMQCPCQTHDGDGDPQAQDQSA